MSAADSQTTSSILMIRPHRFVFNEETMLSNAFQEKHHVLEQEQVMEKARLEFDGMVEKLKVEGVEVLVKEDTPIPPKPDAIFPNNWVMFHHSGEISLFPMEAPNRRYERRKDIIDDLSKEFVIGGIHDFASSERDGKYLEGTGSMIFDHPNRIVYACLSTRTDPGLFKKFCVDMNYHGETFEATDEKGRAIYHTNVIMSLGEKLAVLCTEAIKDEKERNRITLSLAETGHELIEISLDQVRKFAGNMLEVQNKSGEKLMIMSSRAYSSLDDDQLKRISRFARIVHTPLNTIEDIGGGSARCMMAEVFLPRKSD